MNCHQSPYHIPSAWPRFLIGAITILTLTGKIAGQSPSDLEHLPERVSAYMAPYLQMRDFSGRVLVAYRGTVVLDSAFTAPSDAVSTEKTRFGIGSITKTFTAAAVCLLAERGKLRLSDSVGKYIPELAAGRRATIRQLLDHSAGVPDYYLQPDYPRLRSKPITLAEFAKWIGAKPLDFEPGRRSSYSKSGYALLALVVERASGKSYSRFVRDELLLPAGLSSTGQLTSVEGSLAAGHNPAPPPRYLQVPVAFDLSWLTGSGSMYSTTGDLLRWVGAMRSDRLFAFSKLPYPYGWGAHVVRGDSVLEQTARIPAGYTSQITNFVSRDVTVVILSDIQADVVTRIRDAIAAMIFGRPFSPVRVRNSIALADSLTSRYVGRYEFGPGFAIDVRHNREGLELAGPDGDFLPLDAVSATRFFFRPLYVSIGFEIDSAGRRVLNWNGEAKALRAQP